MAKKKQDNTLPILSHILGLFAGFIPPLIILLVTEEERVKKHARRALNWHISFVIYFFASMILVLILIGFVLFFALIIMDIVFCIIASVKASEGELWNYPLAIPFLKD